MWQTVMAMSKEGCLENDRAWRRGPSLFDIDANASGMRFMLVAFFGGV